MRTLILASLLLGFSAFSQAQGSKEKGPCHADRERLCGSVEPGKGAVMKCMKEKEAELSAECKAHREQMKSAMQDMKEACQEDFEKFCDEARPGRGRIMRCLHKNRDKLSEACKSEMKDMRSMRKGKGKNKDKSEEAPGA